MKKSLSKVTFPLSGKVKKSLSKLTFSLSEKLLPNVILAGFWLGCLLGCVLVSGMWDSYFLPLS